MDTLTMSIDILDDDHLLHIFKYLSVCDRVTIQSVCKRWHKVCSSLWKAYHSFDVCDEELGFGFITGKEINFSICTKVFESSFTYLTKINLSWTKGSRNLAIIDLCRCCALDKLKAPEKTLNNLKKTLLNCENIEELGLCRCVIEVLDEDLIEIFQKNRKLRVLVLSNYDFSGKCLLHVLPQKLESIVLEDCEINLKYVSSIAHKAPKLHTLGMKNCISSSNEISLDFSPQLKSNLKRLDLDGLPPFPDIISGICDFKNLTILNLHGAILEDYEITDIIRSCKKLVVLDISFGTSLTDACLSDLRFLPQLKCLNISSNRKISSGGLQYLSGNLQQLLVAMNKFSEIALLKALQRMQNLEVLDVSCMEHLKNKFIESAINIVKNRPNKIPLKIGLMLTSTELDKVQNDCSKIELIKDDLLRPDYNQYL